MVLKVGGWDWGPKPFRFNNSWLENSKLKEVVDKVWNSQSINGWMGFVWKEKFKVLKGRLRVWNKEEHGLIDDRITRLKEEIEELDVRGEESLLNEEEVQTRRNNFSLFWSLLKSKDSLVVQKSRVKWLKEGDADTKFFYNCMKARASGICVRALKVNDDWVQTSGDVRRVIVEYFRIKLWRMGELDRLWME